MPLLSVMGFGALPLVNRPNVVEPLLGMLMACCPASAYCPGRR